MRFPFSPLMLISIAIATTAACIAQSTSGELLSLTGHKVTTAEVVKVSNDIVLAKFLTTGSPSPGPAGGAIYDAADVQVISALKGEVSGKFQAHYLVWITEGSSHEDVPIIGTQYIMFIHRHGSKEFEIRKLIPASDESVAHVKSFLEK